VSVETFGSFALGFRARAALRSSIFKRFENQNLENSSDTTLVSIGDRASRKKGHARRQKVVSTNLTKLDDMTGWLGPHQ
jgi:hypothetical protein